MTTVIIPMKSKMELRQGFSQKYFFLFHSFIGESSLCTDNINLEKKMFQIANELIKLNRKTRKLYLHEKQERNREANYYFDIATTPA